MNTLKFVSSQKHFDFDDFTILPQRSNISERDEIVSLLNGNNIPTIMSSPMDTITGRYMIKAMRSIGCDGVIHRYQSTENIIEIARTTSNPIVAIGSVKSHKATIDALLSEGVTRFVIDVAHGGSQKALDTVTYLRNKLSESADIWSGSICTYEAARDNFEAGATGLRVGVSPGNFCETRTRIGVGIPLPASICDITSFAKLNNLLLIGDGGIRNSGDFVKAIACGANTVFIGSSFGATYESEGLWYRKTGENTYSTISGPQNPDFLYKRIRGMASYSALTEHNKEDKNKIAVEGREDYVRCRGSVVSIATEYLNALKQAMFYTGSRTIEEFHERVDFAFI